jgi:hypothetical protein
MKLSAETLRRLVRESINEAPVRVDPKKFSNAPRGSSDAEHRKSAAADIKRTRADAALNHPEYGGGASARMSSVAKMSGAPKAAAVHANKALDKGYDKDWVKSRAAGDMSQAAGPHLTDDDPMAELDQISSLGGMDELDEDMMPAGMHPSVGDRKAPPPLPGKKPGGGAPNLKGFKADCNMMADAASRVKQILDAGQGDTKEALRWLDKVVQFAQSAQKNLKN